jgi:DNA polymerase-1
MSELDDVKVSLVESLEDAWHFLTWVRQARPILAIDTETTGLKWWTTNFTRLVQFGDANEAWAIGAREWWQVIAEAMDWIVASGQPVAMHNAKFDMHAIEVSGWSLPAWHQVYDTKVMDHLCYPIRSHSLKPMGKRRYGRAATIGDDVMKKRMNDNGWWWDTIPIDEVSYWFYGGMDTVMTARFATELGWELRNRGLLPAYEREMAVQAIAYRMEKRGLTIDMDYTQALHDQWQEEQCKTLIQLEAWNVSNPHSKDQVVKALKRKEDWDPEEFTETGEPKLDKTVLEGMDSQIAPLVLKYKRLVKWSQAYLRHFLDESVSGVVHPSINTMAARTGRMSIQNPALQTLPSKEASIRKCIVPEGEGELWAVDYDAMELRVMASLSGDPGLHRIFTEGLDPHSYVASVVYGLPYEELVAGQHKAQRGTAKNTQFARIYGAGAERIAITAGVPQSQIEEFIRIYNVRFPGVDQFMKNTEQQAKHRLLHEGEPYVTTPYGRWLNCEPDALYKLVNYAIQGGCADLLKDKMVLVEKMGLGDRMLLPVHDELVLQCSGEEATEISRLMEEHEKFDVPLTCSPEGPFTSWGEAYE